MSCLHWLIQDVQIFGESCCWDQQILKSFHITFALYSMSVTISDHWLIVSQFLSLFGSARNIFRNIFWSPLTFGKEATSQPLTAQIFGSPSDQPDSTLLRAQTYLTFPSRFTCSQRTRWGSLYSIHHTGDPLTLCSYDVCPWLWSTGHILVEVIILDKPVRSIR